MAAVKSLWGYVTAMFFIAMFVIAIITFEVTLAENNNAQQDLLDNPTTREFLKDINTTLETSYQTQQGIENASVNSPVTKTGVIPFIDATEGLWKTLKTIPTTTYNLIVGMLRTSIFQGAALQILVTVVGFLFTAGIILAAYKFFSSGDAKSET